MSNNTPVAEQIAIDSISLHNQITDYKHLLETFTNCPKLIIDNPQLVKGTLPTDADNDWAQKGIKKYEEESLLDEVMGVSLRALVEKDKEIERLKGIVQKVKWTDDDMMSLIDWCGGEEGFNLIDEGETTETLFKKYLKALNNNPV